jgi:hypothetical protein
MMPQLLIMPATQRTVKAPREKPKSQISCSDV